MQQIRREILLLLCNCYDYSVFILFTFEGRISVLQTLGGTEQRSFVGRVVAQVEEQKFDDDDRRHGSGGVIPLFGRRQSRQGGSLVVVIEEQSFEGFLQNLETRHSH